LIIDVNAYLGHWPFRQLRHNTAGGLLRLMDRNGIDKAVVSSINAIFYKNCHSGNHELAAETKAHRDRLIPFATLNPQYPGWEDDLKQCHEDFGMPGIRLFPHYHNHKLTDYFSLNMIHNATNRGMALSVPMRVVDRRQRHWLDNVGDLAISDIEHTMQECPEAKFIILNGRGFQNSGLIKDETLGSSEFLIEISRLSVVLQEEIPKLIEALGPEKLAFGTGIPFKYPGPALLKMQILEIPEESKEKIRWRNVARMLNI
jgi:predicted TIM-barrel fold metal-dependent hydrolase